MSTSSGGFDGQMISRHDGINTTRIFRLILQYTAFYFVADKNKQIVYPLLDQKWKEGVLAIAKRSTELLRPQPVTPITGSSSKRQKTGNHDTTAIASAHQDFVQSTPVNTSLDRTSTTVTTATLMSRSSTNSTSRS